MKNGTALKALSDELNHYSSNHSSLDYYQEPIPSSIDLRMDESVGKFMAADPADRKTFLLSLTPASRSQFGIYGHRAATRAMRENRQDLLQLGLTAAVIANYIIPDNRRVEFGLAIYHYTAAKLGLKPLDIFVDAADFAAGNLAAQLVAFGNRSDVTLKKYGWKEVQSPDGVLYRFDWK